MVEILKQIVEAGKQGDVETLQRLAQEAMVRAKQEKSLDNARAAQPEPTGWGKAVIKQLAEWLGSRTASRKSPLGISPPVVLEEGIREMVERKALTLGNTSALRQPFRTGIVDLPARTGILGVTGLLNVVPVSTDVVEYVVENDTTGDAGLRVEYTTTPKPEVEASYQLKQATVYTVAAATTISRQALEDTPQLEALVDSLLEYKLAVKVEDSVLNSTATGFTGILQTSGIGALTGANPQDNLEALLKAIEFVRVQGVAQPTAIVVNPADYTKLLLLKDTTNNYLLGGPQSPLAGTIWQLPVVQSTAISAGTALVGDFTYAVLFDRRRVTLTLADQHADYVLKNLVLLVAEARLGFAVIRPKAFVKVTFTWA